MKVRISYAVELEEVPSKVKCLLEQWDEVLDAISQKSQISNMMLSPGLDLIRSEAVLQNIHEMRMLLSDADQFLQDSSAIIQGYVGVLKTPPKESKADLESPKETVNVDQG